MTKEKFWERIQANVKVDQSEVLRPWDAAELKAIPDFALHQIQERRKALSLLVFKTVR